MAALAAEPDLAGGVVDLTVMVAALNSLDAEDRDVLLLAGWDGLEAAGIGRVLGCSAGAARMRLSRARQRLEDRDGTDVKRFGPSGTKAGERK